jgi:sugar transferase EpsL
VTDIGVASVALVVLSPVIAASTTAVRFLLGSPAIYRQDRPGLDGRNFSIYKLRTMTDERDAAGDLLPDGERLTRFGALLRATSLDELPELWNVLRGDMSLVGPRPLLHRYTPYLTPVERRRFEVRPGITGWAQVHGRNAASWEERLAHDVWYVDNWRPGLDLKILLVTLLRVVKREGVVVDPGSAMLDLDAERRLRATS